jgi:hypothetical protein
MIHLVNAGGERFEAVCASCPECMERKDVRVGDFCTIHWAKVEAESKPDNFLCEHH